MAKILFITGSFFPKSTNAINAGNVIEELKKSGHDITILSVLCEKDGIDEYQNIRVYKIKRYFFANFLKKSQDNKLTPIGKKIFSLILFFRKIKSIFNIFNFPNNDILYSEHVYNVADKLHKEHNFDCVIGVYKPFLSIHSACKLKKKYKNLLCIGYYLDLISSRIPSLFPEKFYKMMCIYKENKIFNQLDYVLLPKAGEKIYYADTYKSVNDKFIYVDFPLFKQYEDIKKVDLDKSKTNLIFAGTLDKDIRNPEYLLNCLDFYAKNGNNIRLHLFAQGNCHDIIKKYKLLGNIEIIEYGIIKHERLIEMLFSCDFIINISNSVKNIVPSKIFELFAIGKPIINVLSDADDYTLKYFNKYPFVYNLNSWEMVEAQFSRLGDFLKNNLNVVAEYEVIKEDFIENTPKYTANIVNRILTDYDRS